MFFKLKVRLNICIIRNHAQTEPSPILLFLFYGNFEKDIALDITMEILKKDIALDITMEILKKT